MPLPCRPFALALVAVVAGAASVLAAPPEWPVARGPSHEPAPYRYDPADCQAVPRDFLDDYPACILYAATAHLVAADGTTENVTHEVTRLNGRKGVEKFGEYHAIAFDPAYEKLTLHEARVHKPGGRMVEVGPRHLQLRDSGTDFLVYEPTKQLVISFPDLEVGDVIEVKWSTRGKNPEYAGQFFTRYPFGDGDAPVARDELCVRLPKGQPLQYAATGPNSAGFAPAVIDDGDTQLYRWRARDRRPPPRDERAPSREEFRLSVACSTFADWASVGRWKQTLRHDCWTCTTEIRNIAREVTKGLTDPADKAKALTTWVRRNVRYVSVGEKHDYTPHAPAQVLANRYGDCKDSSQLLAVMLREAGVPVALATLGSRGDGQVIEGVPSPWGTHAILLVTLPPPTGAPADAKPRQVWIDTTAGHAAWDFLPPDDRDRLCYVTDERGLRLARTPKLSADENRIEQRTQLSVGADGSSRAERTVVYRGLAAYERREQLAETPAGERRRLVATELQEDNPRARLRELSLDEAALADADAPLTLRTVFETADHLGSGDGQEGSVTDPALWDRLLSVTPDYDRGVPLELGDPFESVHVFEVTLPPGFRLKGVPAGRTASSAWGSFRREVTADPDDPHHLRIEIRTRLETTRVEPADFEAFRKFQEAVGRGYRVYLGLAPHDDAGEIPALEAVLALAPGDAASAERLARLYLGREEGGDDARRVLARAREFTPDGRRLWELAADAEADAEGAAGVYREMVERFPDEPKYRLQLGRALAEAGDLPSAREALAAAAKAGGSAVRAESLVQLATLSLPDDPETALKHLSAAEKADPVVATRAGLHVGRGDAYEAMGKTDDARVAFRQALAADPDDRDALEALTRLAWKAGEGPEAVAHLRRLASLAETPEEFAAAADWSLKLGRLDDAADLAGRAEGDKGLLPSAYRTLGLVALRRGQPDAAVGYLESADAPGDPEVVDGRLRSLLLLGRLREARALWAESPLAKGKLTPALTRTAERLRAIGARFNAVKPTADEEAGTRAAEAFVTAEARWLDGAPAAEVEKFLALAEAVGSPALALRAQLELDRGRLGRALEWATKALAGGASEPRALAVRGRVYLEREDARALADLEAAATLTARKDAAVLAALAAALERAGRRDDALAALTEATSLRPDDIEIARQAKELRDRPAPMMPPKSRASGSPS
jgi:tetratricopeptide (TPR) repeat protein